VVGPNEGRKKKGHVPYFPGLNNSTGAWRGEKREGPRGCGGGPLDLAGNKKNGSGKKGDFSTLPIKRTIERSQRGSAFCKKGEKASLM